MSMTESYLTILESSLDRKLGILDSLEKLNTEQEAVLGAASFDEEAFGNIVGQKAELVEQLNAVLPHFFMIDDQSLARCASQPQVFANAALGNRRQLLMDHGNAGIQCLKRIFELDLLAFKYNLAGCRRMNAD